MPSPKPQLMDTADVAPGEELEVSIRAPFAGAGLITIERERVHAFKWFRSDGTSSVQRIRVPDDLAICGFGNAEIGRETCPALTTVDLRSHEMGRRAAQALLARFEGRTDAPSVVDVGFEIVERQSA